MTSSEFSLSSGEEEQETVRATRKSARTTPQKQPTRRVSKRTSYAAESSDEDEAPEVKKSRPPLRSKRANATENRRSKSPAEERGNDGPSVSSDRTSKQSPSTSAANKVEQEKTTPSRSHFRCVSSDEEETPPKSPKKISFAKQSEDDPAVINGAARTSAKKGSNKWNDIPEKDLIPALVHSLKVNTAMMGDLAAELRLLRESLVSQNRKK